MIERHKDGRLVAVPEKLWATEYKTGWTVYSVARHILAEGLTEPEARRFLEYETNKE